MPQVMTRLLGPTKRQQASSKLRCGWVRSGTLFVVVTLPVHMVVNADQCGQHASDERADHEKDQQRRNNHDLLR